MMAPLGITTRPIHVGRFSGCFDLSAPLANNRVTAFGIFSIFGSIKAGQIR
jgi:hypothetical protein